jgi:hypothetical protein
VEKKMSINLKLAEEKDQNEWDNVILSSSHGTIFHTWKWLKITEAHTGNRLYPFMAYNGTELVAIYPIFIQKKKGLIPIALSPPSQSYLLYLGPVIAGYDSMKMDKKESVFLHVQEEINRVVFSDLGCKYFRVRSSPGIYDSRPLRWTGFIIEPHYTYRIDLSKGSEHVWNRFDRKLRVDINRATKEHVEIHQGDLEDLMFVADSLSRRFYEQGFTPNNYREYLTDLFRAFYPNNLKIFIAHYNGQRIGGMVTLCFKQVIYLWIGIPKSQITGISPNDLVQWEAIKWGCENGYLFYEEMDGGNNLRLRHFKSKYNPDLCIWYTGVNYSSRLYKLAEKFWKGF